MITVYFKRGTDAFIYGAEWILESHEQKKD